MRVAVDCDVVSTATANTASVITHGHCPTVLPRVPATAAVCALRYVSSIHARPKNAMAATMPP